MIISYNRLPEKDKILVIKEFLKTNPNLTLNTIDYAFASVNPLIGFDDKGIPEIWDVDEVSIQEITSNWIG